MKKGVFLNAFFQVNSIANILVSIRPERAEAPSPGQSPWVFMDASLSPCFTLIEQALSVFFNVNYI